MSIDHNRIKVADLETDEPNKILVTNDDGVLEFKDIGDISYNDLDYTSQGKVLDARQGKALKEYADAKVADAIADGKTDVAPSQNAVHDALNLKVDKVFGKGLSTEDYATAEKNLVATIGNKVDKTDTHYVGTTAIVNNRTSAPQTLTGVSIDGNANTVTNGVYSTINYVNPSWLTSLTFNKLSEVPNTLAGHGITDAYTKIQVDTAIANLVDSAPGVLDTLNELANALGDDPNFATTITGQIGGKENAFSKNTAFNKNFGTTAGTVAEGNDSRILHGETAYNWGNHAGLYKSLSYVPNWSEITGKPTLLSQFTNDLGNYGNWITKVQADSYYYPLSGNPSGFITSSALVTYALKDGSNSLGTWPISITGNSQNSQYSVRTDFVQSNDGDRNPDTKLPTTSPQQVRFDFIGAGFVGANGNYAGLMTYAPWTGDTSSTGDSSYQLAFVNETGMYGSGLPGLKIRKGIDSTWGSWHKLWHSGNFTPSNYLDKTQLSANRVPRYNGSALVNGNVLDDGGTVTITGALGIDTPGGYYSYQTWNNSGNPVGLIGTGGCYGSSQNNFGAYVYGNNDFDIFTNGLRRFVIKGGGYAGFGTNNPQQPFVVSRGGTEGFEIYLDGSNTVGLQAYNRSAPAYSKMEFAASSYNFTNGNFGIGKPTPGVKLDVDGDIRASQVLYSNSGLKYGSGIEISNQNLDDIKIAGFYRGSSLTSSSFGLPSVGWYYVTVESHNDNNAWIYQRATSFGTNAGNSDTGITYTRVNNGGSWTNWVKIWDSGSFNPNNYLSTSGSGATGNWNIQSLGLTANDTRSVNATPTSRDSGFYFDMKSNSTDGLNDGGTYHSTLTVRRHGVGTDVSGGKIHQLAFTDNNNMWIRMSNTATAWSSGGWQQVWTSSNLNPNEFFTQWGGMFIGSIMFDLGSSIFMQRGSGNNTQTGISWYSTNYDQRAWIDYMAQANTTNQGPSGDITAPSGSIVTSWARRSFIENVSGYGWTFESGAMSSTTPTVVAEISSVTGSARFAGTVTASNGTASNHLVTKAQLDSISVGTSGKYTPTFSGASNCGTPTGFITGVWTKVGNMVNFTVGFQITVTNANTLASIQVSLPFNRTATNVSYCGVVGMQNASNSSLASTSGAGSLSLNITDKANIILTSNLSGNSYFVSASFQYSLI